MSTNPKSLNESNLSGSNADGCKNKKKPSVVKSEVNSKSLSDDLESVFAESWSENPISSRLQNNEKTTYENTTYENR